MRCYCVIKEVDITKLVFALNFNIIFCMIFGIIHGVDEALI